MISLALILACGSGEPAPPPPAVEPPPVEDKKPETAEERRARLMAEADRRAGLEPGQPLPKWDLSALKDAPPPPVRTCKAGALGTLQIEGGVIEGATLETLLAGPAALSVPTGRHAGETGLSVSRLMGAGAVTTTGCGGETVTLTAEQNATADALVLVPNSRGELKLIDTSASDGGRQPLARSVTSLAR
ncbi:MAG: hypothetical protein H6742_14640 [Alphaproteobacteria bacterium]|nr:hypothetical protein [Alphaproteobacteria bacterium]